MHGHRQQSDAVELSGLMSAFLPWTSMRCSVNGSKAAEGGLEAPPWPRSTSALHWSVVEAQADFAVAATGPATHWNTCPKATGATCPCVVFPCKAIIELAKPQRGQVVLCFHTPSLYTFSASSQSVVRLLFMPMPLHIPYLKYLPTYIPTYISMLSRRSR